MVQSVLLLFGATFIYAGVITMPQDVLAGTCSTLLGTALIINPLVQLIQLVKKSFVSPPPGGSSGRREREMRRGASWLENDEKITYH